MPAADHPPTPADTRPSARNITRWSYLALSLALIWLAAAALFFSQPSPPIIPLIILALAGIALALDATARLAAIIISRRHSPRTLTAPLLRWLAVPLIGLLGIALLITDADLKLRIALADATMRTQADAALNAKTDAEARHAIGAHLGLFPANHTERQQGRLRIETTTTGLFSTAGLYYAPNGMNTGTTNLPAAESESVRHIEGPWYAFQWSD